MYTNEELWSQNQNLKENLSEWSSRASYDVIES